MSSQGQRIKRPLRWPKMTGKDRQKWLRQQERALERQAAAAATASTPQGPLQLQRCAVGLLPTDLRHHCR